MLKLFKKYLTPYWQGILATLLLLFLQALANLFLPFLMSQIIDNGVVKGDMSYIISTGLFMLFVALIGGFFVVVANFFSSRVAMRFSRDVREQLFIKVESFNLEEFDTIGTSSLITRTTNDVTQVQQVVLMSLRMMVTAPLMMIGGLIMAISTNARLSIILIVSMPLLVLVIFLVSRKGLPLFTSMQKKLDRINLIVRENLTGVRVVRAFNRKEFEQERFNAANLDLTDTSIKVNKILAVLMPTMTLLMNLTSVLILWFGATIIDSGQLEVGSLIAFIQYVMHIMMSLVMLSMMFIMVPRAAASGERIREVLEMPFSIKDTNSDTLSTTLHGEVEFKNVSFFYPGSEEPALSHISFKATPGRTTAIIGGTGSGKSTLTSLITRFYDASEGEVLVNGINVKNFTQEQLRAYIGLVPQKAILFSGSIRDNLRFGKEDASDEAIWEALDIAQSTRFVSEKEGQLDAFIAQGGTNVSGGQRQRLSIARALVRQPEIYIFDDSFSALDFKTDKALRHALKPKTKDAATILVAQRISTIIDADEILVLVDGHLVGKGTHKELLENCPDYLEIALSQLSKEEIENV